MRPPLPIEDAVASWSKLLEVLVNLSPFLMAYLTLLVVCGMPMICIEMAAGRVTQSGPIAAIAKLCPLMKETFKSCR
ncbi:hypothetical protein HPB52_013929 [Rhipicephalus sanguineus]|uniref:Uncharacterized protein n=1 Tax=Rhipicephalus sanguineus TaxID=34632 RepID=A0A9D4PW97_RHISA|nr:hypothetical protein HPB52_013929 [Rhipicephalus sanguineus]